MGKHDFVRGIPEIAWLAGLLEGEGSFGVSWRHDTKSPEKRPRFTLQLAMTDEDIVQRVANMVDENVNGPYKYTTNRKPYWRVSVQKTAKLIGWLMTLYSFMGKRRRLQFAHILHTWRVN